MSVQTKIEFTHHTSSPWWGCSKVHSGCANCYAETWDSRFKGNHWGAGGTRKRIASFGVNCLKWQRQASREGVRKRVFLSMCDPFEKFSGAIVCNQGRQLFGVKGQPLDLTYLRRLDMFATIDACPDLDFLLFTKRPENILSMWPGCKYDTDGDGNCQDHPKGCPRKNVWLVASVSTQGHADKMIPELLKCRELVPVLGVSYEPALGPIDFTPWLKDLAWIVAGGESGPGARPAHPDWFRSVRDQCAKVAVPFFFKQWGEWIAIDKPWDQDWPAPLAKNERWLNTKGGCGFHGECVYRMRRVTKKKTGRLLDGMEYNGMPLTTNSGE